MTSFTSLLVITDLSFDDDRVVRRAALVAHAHGARLHVLHMLKAPGIKSLRHWFVRANDIEVETANALGTLRRLATEISRASDVVATVEVVASDRFELLMQAAGRADLVVLGGRRLGRTGGWLFGSTAGRVLRSCPSPMLVVRGRGEHPYQRVLVPIDFTAGSDAAIQVASRIRREAGMHLLHTIDSPREAVLRDADVPDHVIRQTRLREEAGARARMHRRIASLGLDGAGMAFALAHGPVVRSTVRHAREIGADLIVAGKPRRSTVAGMLLASVSGGLLSGSACDVLIVPEPRTDTLPQAPLSPAHWIHRTATFIPRRPS